MQGVSVAELGIKYLGEVISRFNGGCIYLAIYFACIIFLCIRGNKRDRKIFVPMTILLIVTVYNPLFPLILSKFADINSEYYRFFWMTPVIVLVPLVATKLITELVKEKSKSNTWALIIIAFIFVSSSVFMYKNGIVFAENMYKIPNELIKISEILADFVTRL